MNEIELRSQLLPDFTPSCYSISENPLAVLARTQPSSATNLMHRILDQKERSLAIQRDMAQLALLRGVSSDHTAAICNWLNNRHPGERHAEAETCGVVQDNALFFGRGQRVRLRTTFHIW